MREEIEIELLSLRGEPFTGSITMLEAKHGLYRDCLFLGSKTGDQRFGEMQKKQFFTEICCKILAFLRFFQQKCWKWWFRPTFGVRSTQTLVEIYNTEHMLKLDLHSLHSDFSKIRQFFWYSAVGCLPCNIKKVIAYRLPDDVWLIARLQYVLAPSKWMFFTWLSSNTVVSSP